MSATCLLTLASRLERSGLILSSFPWYEYCFYEGVRLRHIKVSKMEADKISYINDSKLIHTYVYIFVRLFCFLFDQYVREYSVCNVPIFITI